MENDDSTAAWMLCDDIITRVKDELILEAVDILHEELKAGRIDLKGYVNVLPDKAQELQRDMYLINNLVQREQEIIAQYAPYLDGNGQHDSDKLSRIEDLRKFVLSVKAISMLMRLSIAAERWALDTGKYSALSDPVQIIKKTAIMADERKEILDFVLSHSKFTKSEALSGEEMGILASARKSMD